MFLKKQIMSRNFSSTCNSKLFHTRDKADHSDYLKLPRSESKVREISQPVKITQLLSLPRVLQTDPKDSIVKISQPERIIPYIKNTSTRKKNGTNIINRFQHSEKSVRRNLKFPETPPTMRKTKLIVKENTNNLHNKSAVSGKSLETHNKKSFLLPPDSIKNKHVAQNRFKQSKSMLPHLNQTRILVEKSVSKCPRISERSESASHFVENTDAFVSNPVVQEKNNKTSVIQHTSSQTHKTNSQSDVNILHFSSTNSTDTNNDVTEKESIPKCSNTEILNDNVCSDENENGSGDITMNKPRGPSICNIDARKNVKLFDGSYLNLGTNAMCTPGVEKIKIEDMYASLQAIKTINKSCMDTQHDINDDSGYVIFSKKELHVLASNLEHVICRMEENMSYLKLAATCVINLSASAISTSKVTNNDEIESKKQVIEDLNDNAKVINNTSAISSCVPIIPVPEIDHNIENASKTLDSNALVCAETDLPEATKDHVEIQSRKVNFAANDNKENEKDTNLHIMRSKSQCKVRRRSARLLAKALKNSNVDNDSFVNLEHELNIVSKQSITPIELYTDRTPVTSGHNDKKTGRPWKEYMALKSRMSCLLTPNIKRFNSAESSNNMHPETGNVRTSLSSKIFADLHNLYSDSPDLQ